MIARSDKVTCPVVNLEKYMSLANIDASKASSDYLFKPLVKVRSGFKLIEKVKPLSYTRARESIVGLLKEFVPDTTNISLHSFRAGGATAAANAQVQDRCWKRHGRWRSDSAKDGYVEDSVDNRLLVSQSLGIYYSIKSLGSLLNDTFIRSRSLISLILCSSQYPIYQ